MSGNPDMYVFPSVCAKLHRHNTVYEVSAVLMDLLCPSVLTAR